MGTKAGILAQLVRADNPYSDTQQRRIARMENTVIRHVSQVAMDYESVLEAARELREIAKKDIETAIQIVNSCIDTKPKCDCVETGERFETDDYEAIVDFMNLETIGKGENWGVGNEPETKHVIATNHETGKEIPFTSYGFAALFFGMHGSFIAKACRMGTPIMNGKYSVRYKF
jgi:hypothetical protein